MYKKLSKILKTFILIIFLFQLTSLVFLLATPEISNAADPIKFKPQVDIPGTPGFQGEANIDPTSIGKYISAIYKYAIGIVGILATVVMMFGGILWIMAGGNQERVNNAKSWLTAAITGLVLALSSYMLLYLVNPDLVKFEPIDPEDVLSTNKSNPRHYDCYWEPDANKCEDEFNQVALDSDCSGNKPELNVCCCKVKPEPYCMWHKWSRNCKISMDLRCVAPADKERCGTKLIAGYDDCCCTKIECTSRSDCDCDYGRPVCLSPGCCDCLDD